MQPTNASAPSISGKRIALTGARGFIGSHLLNALLAGGAQVTVLLRTGHGAGRLRKAGAKVVIAPLQAGAALNTALDGQEILINTAYDVRASKAVNMAAFDALLGAAKTAGVQRIVHTSSAVVYDSWPNGVIDENSTISPNTGGDYRQNKVAMEQKLMASDFKVVILQPTIVYGPNSAMWTRAPMEALAAGGVVLPTPCGTCAAVYIDDVVQAFVRACELIDPQRERFLINGPGTVNWQEFYQGYRDILGRGDITLKPADELTARLGPAPQNGVASGPSLAARVSAQARRLIGTQAFDAVIGRLRNLRHPSGPQYPDRHMLTLMLASPEVSIDHARKRLGYVPTFDFQRGLAEIAAHKP